MFISRRLSDVWHLQIRKASSIVGRLASSKIRMPSRHRSSAKFWKCKVSEVYPTWVFEVFVLQKHNVASYSVLFEYLTELVNDSIRHAARVVHYMTFWHSVQIRTAVRDRS